MEETRLLQATAVAFVSRLDGPEREVRIQQLAELLRLGPEVVAVDLTNCEVRAQLEAACPALAQSSNLSIPKWLDGPEEKRRRIEERIRSGDVSEVGWRY